jgi:hypothetical protein
MALVRQVFISILILYAYPLSAQLIIKGHIKDSHSEEIIPFASIQFQNSTIGKLSDSAGSFSFNLDEWPSDTLEISYVGYDTYKLFIDRSQKMIDVIIPLERGRMKKEVVIKSKHGRGWFLWRKIVKRKPFNNRNNFHNFSYELYNKLELDIRNFNRKMLRTFKLPKELDFVLKYIDTSSEETPFLPVFFTETISNYYHSEYPTKSREVIKATKSSGINNESVSKFFGGMYQNVNVYKNFIPVFDKNFVSPISDNGDLYYDYRLVDTQYVAGKRLLHLVFAPKHKGENTFDGDCWVHDSTFAIQKMNLRLAKEANINHVEKLSLVQEYRQLNDSTWTLYKDKFVVDLSPFNLSNKMMFTGRKTTTYKDIVINNDSVALELKKNKLQEEIILEKDAMNKDVEYWQQSRHDSLDKNEVQVYKMVDTLMSIPKFRNYTEWINFIATGYRNVGNFQIGPWMGIIGGNYWEGTRVRFDLGTNHHFNKNLYLHGYLAYGFRDQAFKEQAEMLYIFKRHPRMTAYLGYRKDFDNGQHFYDDNGYENLFEAIFRRANIPIKFMMKEELRGNFFTELPKGFSVRIGASRQRYNPLRFLPTKTDFASSAKGESLNTFETSVTLRFAYMENFLENNFFRTSLGSTFPIVEIRYNKGISGVFNSSYDYSKLFTSVSDYLNIPPLGRVYYNFFGGKVWGTLPFMLLEVHPGNESYFYNPYVFNMMNRFEFVSDRYAGFNVEHNIGNGIFRLLSVTRKLKMRQFWNAKAVWGDLSNANKQLNFVGTQSFQGLGGRPYIEVGTGIENILRLFRVDFVWRLTPKVNQPLPGQSSRNFGVFGSFKIGF